MSDSKHTLGPWRAVVRSNQTGVCSVGVDVHPDGAWVKRGYAKVYNETDAANARLIAAAPELLEALRLAESFISGFEGDELQDGIDERLATIRDAIAKAEGRS